jgi:hypothetical protein
LYSIFLPHIFLLLSVGFELLNQYQLIFADELTFFCLVGLVAETMINARLLKAAEYLGKKEREDFEKELALLTSLLRDLFLLASGRSGDSIANIDVADRLTPLAQKVGLRRLMTWAEKLDDLRANLRININRQVATEAALLELAEAR